MTAILDMLRDEFDESLFAEVDDDGAKVIISAFEYTPAEILKKTLGEQYDNLLSQWFQQDWLPERLETYDRLLTIEDNAARLAALIEKIRKNLCVPFIGSGMSASSGLKTWGDLLRSLSATAKMPANDCEEHLAAARYETLAEILYANIPTLLFDEKLENRLHVALENLDGAIRYSPMLFASCPFILTTNFDDILEQLFAKYELVLEQPLYGRNLMEFSTRRESSRCFIIKIHGDYKLPHTRVLLKSEYDSFYGDAACCAELALMFSNYSCLFLGCSLNADRTLDILKSVAESKAKTPRHYALLHKGDDFQEIERRLAEYSIFPIWYDGDHDEGIEALFMGMLKQLGKI